MSRITKVDPEDPKEVLDRLAPRGQQQEWIGNTVRGLLPHENPCWIEEEGLRTYFSDKDLEPVATAHNAELAAERHRREQELAEVREPLVEALEQLRCYTGVTGNMLIDDALAKMKEHK